MVQLRDSNGYLTTPKKNRYPKISKRATFKDTGEINMVTKMQKNPQYTPCATYFHDSDCVEYVKHDAFSIYDRIDEFLTLIWDKTGQELVGFKLKGFKNIFTKRLRPHIEINDEQFLRIVSAIEHICVDLGEALTADDERKRSYQAAADMAANDNVQLSRNYLEKMAA